MRIALFTRYGAMGASSRVRTLQFLPWLEAQGVQVEVFPLLDDTYLESLYTRGRRPPGALVNAYFRRVSELKGLRRRGGSSGSPPPYQLLWVEKELFPWLPFWLEAGVRGVDLPMVVDYDDAIFHQYDEHRSALVRLLLGEKIDRVMRSAQVVVAGNDYLAARARRAGAGEVEIIPSVVPMERYPEPTASESGGSEPFVLGWMGTPITAQYLRDVAPVLAEVAESHGVRIRTVGSGPLELPGVEVEVRPWRLESEGAEAAGFSAGIMPLRDGPWERGKCGYKLVQYMAAGRPVVASAVGAARDIVVDGETGFLVRGPGDWARAIRWLVEHPDEARVMGLRGRERARKLYSEEAVAPRLLQIFRRVTETG